MQPVPAYYSLVQYCPDPSRMEVVNVGVILHAPKVGKLVYRLTANDRRLQRLFGRQNRELIQLERQALAERLGPGLEAFPSDEAFLEFAETRAGLLRLSRPRHIKVSDADTEIHHLFERLVGDDPAPRRRVGQARQLFEEALFSHGLKTAVSRAVQITLPDLNRTFSAPYSYRNGHLNLIEPVNFVSAESAFDTACRRAVEGRAIARAEDPANGAMKLIVVAHFSEEGSSQKELVRATLIDSDVELYDLQSVEPLLADIRRHLKGRISNRERD